MRQDNADNAAGEEDAPRWAIRLTARAHADIEAAWQHFAFAAGEGIADLWREGLERALATLAVFPARLPVASEHDFFPEIVRALLYRRTPTGPAYRVLFVQRDSMQDGPIVGVLRVRPASAAPLTEDEAAELAAEAEREL